jgi:hypothetical protein
VYDYWDERGFVYMKKNIKKILAICVLGLFALMFAPQFVSAAETGSQDGVLVLVFDALFGGLGDLGDISGEGGIGKFLQERIGIVGAEGASASTILAFFLIMFLVVMLTYEIMGLLPFFSDKGWMRWVFSAGFAFLAFLSFDIGEIKHLASTYQAVGITMIAIIPFLVIYAFVWSLDKRAENETKPSFNMFGTAIWAFFGVYLLLKWRDIRSEGDSIIITAYMVFAIVALFQVFMHGKIYRWISGRFNSAKRKAGVRKGNTRVATRLRNEIDALQESMKSPENQTQEKYGEIQKEIRSLKAALDKIGSWDGTS